MKLSLPLKHIYVNQPFGVNYVNFYSDLGMKGHNGIDFKAHIGCKTYATHDGVITKVRNNDDGLYNYIEITGDWCKTRHGHLSDVLLEEGVRIKAGQPIGLTGNTGKYTTGAHLHYDMKIIGYNYNNGFFGASDPSIFFMKDWDKSSAYHRYGRDRQYLAEVKMRFKNPWLHRQLKKKNNIRLIEDNEFINALVYGGWDFESLMNPAMWENWAYLKKDEFKKGIKAFL